jgi:hypothetical protein
MPHETILVASRAGVVSETLAMHDVADIVLGLFGLPG